MGTPAFLFSGREHGIYARHRHAKELLSVSASEHQRKGKGTEEDKQAKSLHIAFYQCPGKMGAHRKAECAELIYTKSLLLRSVP